jgi:hypothetical protein
MVDDQPAKEHPVARGHTIKIERDAIVFYPIDFCFVLGSMHGFAFQCPDRFRHGLGVFQRERLQA